MDHEIFKQVRTIGPFPECWRQRTKYEHGTTLINKLLAKWFSIAETDDSRNQPRETPPVVHW